MNTKFSISKPKILPILFVTVSVFLVPKVIAITGEEAYNIGEFNVATEMWQQEAVAGDVKAQFNLGVMFWEGKGTEPDYKKAVKWFTRAANNGHADSQYNLGNAYFQGRGVAKNPQQAVRWWEASAKQGIKDGQYSIGRALMEGYGVSRDPERGTLWLELAAENGSSSAKQYLQDFSTTPSPVTGDDDCIGVVPKDAVQNWFADAKTGDDQAQYCLGKSFVEGYGTDTDRRRGLIWLKMSAGKGNVPAQNYLDVLDGKRPATVAVASTSAPVVADSTVLKPLTTTASVDSGSPSEPDTWLFAQQPNAYTLQYAISDSLAKTQGYLNTRDDSNFLFRAYYAGKPWYYILSGSYSSRSQANASKVSGMPSPHVRRFRELQEGRCKYANNVTDEIGLYAFCQDSGRVAASSVISPARVAQSSGGINDNGWLYQQPRTNYTIQLFSTKSSAYANQAMRRLQSQLSDMHMFSTSVNGEQWYYILSGSYSDIYTAEDLLESLPAGYGGAIAKKISILQSRRCAKQYEMDSEEAAALGQYCST